MSVLAMVDAVAYINLDHRPDRFESIRKELQRLTTRPQIIARISGTFNPTNGLVGCCQSHIRAWQHIAARATTFGCVFEDDFMIDTRRSLAKHAATIRTFWKRFPQANVLMLAINPYQVKPSTMPGVVHVNWGLSGSAYMVRVSYIPKLIACMRVALKKERHFDLEWKTLQDDETWFGLQPPVGIQRKSYSDIEHRVMFYGV